MDSETTASANTQQTTGPTVPESWPGAFGVYKYSRDAVKFNLGTIIGLILTSLLVSILLGGRTGSERNGLSLVGDLINVWINAAMIVAFLAGARLKKVDFAETLRKGGKLYLNFLGLSILSGIIIVLSIVALIVPFFFIFPRIILANYYLIDKNMGPIEALKASWNDTKEHTGKVWGIVGAALLMAIGIVVLIGIYFLIMYSAVLAILYVYVQNTKSNSTSSTEVANTAA